MQQIREFNYPLDSWCRYSGYPPLEENRVSFASEEERKKKEKEISSHLCRTMSLEEKKMTIDRGARIYERELDPDENERRS